MDHARTQKYGFQTLREEDLIRYWELAFTLISRAARCRLHILPSAPLPPPPPPPPPTHTHTPVMQRRKHVDKEHGIFFFFFFLEIFVVVVVVEKQVFSGSTILVQLNAGYTYFFPAVVQSRRHVDKEQEIKKKKKSFWMSRSLVEALYL